MSKTYDIYPITEQIRDGKHDEDLFSILEATWDRMPTVEREEWLAIHGLAAD